MAETTTPRNRVSFEADSTWCILPAQDQQKIEIREGQSARQAQEALRQTGISVRESFRDPGLGLRQGLLGITSMCALREEFLKLAEGHPRTGADPVFRCRAVLQNSGRLWLRVFGSSMLPAVWPGDVLVVAPAEAAGPGVGDLVLFNRGDRLFAHRILKVQGHGCVILLTTRGDALPQTDPPITGSDVLGRVVAILRDGRPVARLRPSGAQKMFAWMLRHSGPAFCLLIRLHEWQRRAARNRRQSELAWQDRKPDNPVVSTKA